MNKEFNGIFNDTVITNYTNNKSRRLRWQGHLERMNHEKEVKRITGKIPTGKNRKKSIKEAEEGSERGRPS